jgi:hypothetical protein
MPLGRSFSTSQATVSPVTGTSIENGATTPAGWQPISQVQMPLPSTVAGRTV